MVERRYERNIGAISEAEQEKLRQSRVLIVGCGGLGSTVLMHLLRVGVGHITVVDGDVFDETNLNRQLLCTTANIGTPKVLAAVDYAALIAPDAKLRAVQTTLGEDNADELLRGHGLAVDALDNVPSRKILAAACDRAGVPLVYGAISGFAAQTGVFMPGEAARLMDTLYPSEAARDKSCLSFTPGVCASLQSAQAVKLLLGKPCELDGRLLYTDLLFDEWQYIDLK